MINSPRLTPLPRLVAAALLAGNMNATSEQLSPDARSVQHYDVRVIAKKSFDRDNFVQGLEFDGDRLLVSSGLYGESIIKAYDWPALALRNEQHLPRQLFAEGLTRIGSSIYLLTWRAQRLLILNAKTFALEGSAVLPGEGWGATSDSGRLFWSDGSSKIRSIDVEAGGAIDTINVTLLGKPLTRLNELERIDGDIWANIWQQDEIAIIDPATGVVRGIIHLNDLLDDNDRQPDTDVLNGIAMHAPTGDIWVTGKRWPWLYKITLKSR